MRNLTNRLSWFIVLLTAACQVSAFVVSNPIPLPVAVNIGGTGATTAAAARTNLGAAASGVNSDITYQNVVNTYGEMAAAGASWDFCQTGLTWCVMAADPGDWAAEFVGYSNETAKLAVFCPLGPSCTPDLYVAADDSWVSTKPCASGFTRETPNLCVYSGVPNYATLTANTCTTVAAPAGAVTVLLHTVAHSLADNVSGATRQVAVGAYTSNACSSESVTGAQSVAIEWNASTVGVPLAVSESTDYVTVSGGDIFLESIPDAGGQSYGAYYIEAYTD